MILDVGCGGGVYATVPRGDVNLSMDWPNRKIQNFVFADAHNLPFRDNSFKSVVAFNILEHTKDPDRCIREMMRVAETAIIRQDGILNLANYATPEHLWFQLPRLRFLPYPRTRPGIILSKMLRFVLTVALPSLPRHHQLSRITGRFMPPNQQYETVLKRK
jgi:SAM-dependent methyltransferase